MREWRYSFAILELGTRWTYDQHQASGALLPEKESPVLVGYRRLGGRCGVEKTLLPLSVVEHRPSDPWIYRLSYPGSLRIYRNVLLLCKCLFKTGFAMLDGCSVLITIVIVVIFGDL
jgi:hypothetical protein